MKENLKQFFGPTWLIAIIKIILASAVFYIVLYIEAHFSRGFEIGLPFKIITECTSNNGTPDVYSTIRSTCSHQSYFALFFDSIFWYTVTSLIFNFIKKIFKKYYFYR